MQTGMEIWVRMSLLVFYAEGKRILHNLWGKDSLVSYGTVEIISLSASFFLNTYHCTNGPWSYAKGASRFLSIQTCCQPRSSRMTWVAVKEGVQEFWWVDTELLTSGQCSETGKVIISQPIVPGIFRFQTCSWNWRSSNIILFPTSIKDSRCIFLPLMWRCYQ